MREWTVFNTCIHTTSVYDIFLLNMYIHMSHHIIIHGYYFYSDVYIRYCYGCGGA